MPIMTRPSGNALGRSAEQSCLHHDSNPPTGNTQEFRATFPSPPTAKQKYLPKRRGALSEDMTFDDARRKILELKKS